MKRRLNGKFAPGSSIPAYPQSALQAVMSMIPVNRKFLRGDIYYANLEPHLGSKQGGIRPVVVVQNNTANCYSPTSLLRLSHPILQRSPITKPTLLWTVIGLFCSPL